MTTTSRTIGTNRTAVPGAVIPTAPERYDVDDQRQLRRAVQDLTSKLALLTQTPDQPQILAISATVQPNNTIAITISGNASVASMRYVVAANALPSDATVLAAASVDGQSTSAVVSALLTTAAYVSVFPYSKVSAGGERGPRYDLQFSPQTPAVPEGTVSVDANGVYGFSLDVPSVANSFKWAASTSAYPADGTGSAVNLGGSTTATVNSAGTLSFGQTAFITVTPYTGTGGTGTQLQAAHVRGAYLTYTASKTANYSPQGYKERTNPPVGTQNDGNDNLSMVGSILAGSVQIVDIQLLLPTGTSGVTATQLTLDVNYTNGLGTPVSVSWFFFRKTGSGAVASLGSGSAAQVGWQTLTASLSENTSGRSYQVEVQRMGGNFGPDLGLLTVTYTMGDPKQTL